MERKSITVSIGKGEKKLEVAAEKRVWVESDVLVDEAGLLLKGESLGGLNAADMVKLLNYAEDLKVRAAKRGEHTDTGAKTRNRETARLYCTAMAVRGDLSFMQQYAAEHAKGTRELNAYLDELFESTEDIQEVVDAFNAKIK